MGGEFPCGFAALFLPHRYWRRGPRATSYV